MKTYAEIDHLDLSINGFPNKFPVLYLVTEEDIKRIKGLFIKANLIGFGPDIRSVPFGSTLEYSLSVGDVLEKMDKLPEIQEDQYWILKQVVHWNPIEDLEKLLENYIEYCNTMQKSETAAALRQVIEDLKKDIEHERELKIR